jgi:SAM-dependent methyltransferase
MHTQAHRGITHREHLMKWIFSRRSPSPIEELQQSLEALQRAAPFVPTPWAIAREMLEFAKVGPTDTVYDLGSGDGRIPILAAQEFGCKAVGIERDMDLCRYSERRVAELQLENQVAFQCADFFQADLRPATVVTLYLLSAVNGQLQARLASHLKSGSRVVALDFEVPGWRPLRTKTVVSEASVEYKLLLYARTMSPGGCSASGSAIGR